MVRRKPVNFWANKKVRKQIVVEFMRSDGSIARFRATKTIKKPRKVFFLARRRGRR
ncbi:hypothetical protein J4423_05715 [Candidatus Pacearchaeota archaeon]|nr:hypothetical protein [Candidatus Pacearchaeota archaeon]